MFSTINLSEMPRLKNKVQFSQLDPNNSSLWLTCGYLLHFVNVHPWNQSWALAPFTPFIVEV